MRSPAQVAAITIAVSFILNPQSALAQEPQLTIKVLATIDYPGSGNSTTVQGINDFGDVTGYFEDSTGAIRSFIRYADGTFSEPIVEPNDAGNLTVAKDIDNTGRICGYYFSSDSFHPYRGFFLSGTTYTEFLYGVGSQDIYITGLTDAGDFCVTIGFDFIYSEGMLVLGAGGSVIFNIGDYSQANAVNVHTAIVGNYTVGSTVHGYLREPVFPSARFIFGVDYPGAPQTYLLGLNDGGRIVVGKYVDSAGGIHGLI